MEADFGSRNYTSVEEKLPVSSFGEVKYKGQSTAYFNIFGQLIIIIIVVSTILTRMGVSGFRKNYITVN